MKTAIFAAQAALTALSLLLTVNAEPDNWFDIEWPAKLNVCPKNFYLWPWEQQVCAHPVDIFFDQSEDYSPWTTRPICIKTNETLPGEGVKSDTYCIYTKKDFAEGRGITFITSPVVINEVKNFAAFTNPDSIKGMNDLITGRFGPPPYERRYFPGKGVGLVANRTIVRGDRIMQETPTYVYNRDLFVLFNEQTRIPFHWHAAYLLPEETRVELFALHKHHGGDQVEDLMRTNAFGAYYGEDFALHNNVLPRISRFNHDCRPNAHYYFDQTTMTQYVHAVRHIAPGEEILINYTDSEYTWEERRYATVLSWGFECACSICRQPTEHVHASDRRLMMIKALKDTLNDWSEERPERPQIAETLIALYEQERLEVPIATGYEAAAYAYAVAGDEPRAMLYASKAVEAMTILYGGDHPLTHDMQAMMLNPKAHRTWMFKVPKTNKTEGEKNASEAEEEPKKEEESKWRFF